MCDVGRNNNRVGKSHATRIIHLLLFVLFFAPVSAAASAQSSTFWNENASDQVLVYPTVTVTPTAIPSSATLSGAVLDARGNKVPGAYVLLYMDGGTAPVADNPAYSGSLDGTGYGEYEFRDLRPGNYTVYAEKSDIFMYNGSASIVLDSELDTSLNVIIKGYMAKPTAKPENAHTMAEIAAPIVTALPSIAPSLNATDDIIAKAKDRLIGPVLGLFIIGIAGAGILTLRDMLKPKNKAKVAQQRPAAIEKKVEPGGNTVAHAAPAQKADGNYAAEIKDLALKVAGSGYGDIETLDRINAISKKYGVDQNTIFTDIKRSGGNKL